ncbi:polysaccharide deacetylase family protein, PEP-CTERM locus subfamily [Thiothrix eikelboomii]|uniref:Polysaccharide deacetylase family protein, PEP-CTERM locus subfamily n=1 Tax=Thiothrix eikelboomii TaxID=92487 RepID=A0A1T4WW69_9GAMM|nr:polysaccharide deacetylase family protein [Thiothrix eikelboomii]SKA80861.1 polysaccharide deacetylase family protein, PEP-CTERM locus subfamily [Thiothrix eikelboomii]
MIFSADIEDWQQSVLDFDRPISQRVLNNTLQLLAILAEHQVQATFFVQGMVAERFPELITAIAAQGHELASHAYSHRPLYTLTPAQFKDELERSVYKLEDLTGQKVLGFRAPTFSVRTEILPWYCDTLQAFGLRYDSSIMLAQVRKVYGFADDSILAQIRARGLDTYPLSTCTVLGKSLPVMGGGYFRIYPYALNRWLARQLNKTSGVFYMHPYELDIQEYQEVAKPAGISKAWAVHQFAGRSGMVNKLHKLLTDYPFTSFQAQYYH